ncbi:tetratricopeptide repeat protein [Luteimonas sp. 50]|uniref:Tetratricopeptide repeat protein n=1 Tax=Cognatiluteimonas sedimenti TaxID=2927791 RepID=A0ABT0A1V1_9GAMM|nr:tetratricopeptide repeat protein [Lysobacter sedimenti]MCJ0824970.1 tetratricopeptide repeat protein [Lysobacter sedimenti]
MTGTGAAFAALASALTLGVLVFVLRPLWRGRAAPLPVLSLLAALMLATFGLYRLVGTPAALDPAARKAPDTLQDAIAQLQAQLQRDPRQVEGWRLLGRARAANGQAEQAREAYARAAKLAPDEPDVLVEAAESRALADPRHRFDAQAVVMLRHALDVQPEHQRARWFLGISQRQAGQPAEAAKTWEPLLARVDAAAAGPLRTQIDLARAEAGLPPLPAVAAAPAGNALRVAVSLDPTLAARVRLRGEASVFVIARAPGGPPMPIAAEKHGVAELPFTASLDDADSPMPTQKLSGVQEVEVIARLSMSGDATPQPGDLASKPVRVRLPATAPVELVIGQQAP